MAPLPAGSATPHPALAMLRGALSAATVAGAVVAVVAGLTAGRPGVLGAILGLATVVVFSGLGLVALHASRRTRPQTQFAVALGSYGARIALFGAFLAAAIDSHSLAGSVDLSVLGISVLVCVAAWLTGEIWTYAHLRIPVYDLDGRGLR